MVQTDAAAGSVEVSGSGALEGGGWPVLHLRLPGPRQTAPPGRTRVQILLVWQLARGLGTQHWAGFVEIWSL